MTTNRVKNKPKMFTREELVNMIKAQVLNGVLNEVIVLDDDICEGKGDNLLKEAKNRIFNVLDEVINDVKEIEDITELIVEATVSTKLMVIAQERGREDNEMEL